MSPPSIGSAAALKALVAIFALVIHSSIDLVLSCGNFANSLANVICLLWTMLYCEYSHCGNYCIVIEEFSPF